ncbi:MAG: galactose mutarotase [Verrucomicrobiales bacterium]|nr:galactose mutarotase [Verrucomicrobiales bacterium]
MTKTILYIAITAALTAFSQAEMNITKAPFGKTKDGAAADLYTLDNGTGTIVKITNYGGIITSIVTPDKDGKPGDVALGLDSIADYEDRSPYFGCITGRYANRIAKGKFSIDGNEYTLATNNDANHLHGGEKGFDKHVWDAKTRKNKKAVSLVLTRTSPDGEEGYPGNLATTVTYSLTPEHALRINYKATTDKATHINLTNHTYFNLEGHAAGSALKHRLMLKASKFTPTDAGGIPTGELRPVAGTPHDFTKAKNFAKQIGDEDEQLTLGKGYDHNFIVDGEPGKLRLAARIAAPKSGRVMSVQTTEPAIQLYTANFMTEMAGKDGATYDYRGAFCLETQHYPDSPNQKAFPSTLLQPGETYDTTTIYKFGIRKPKKAE